MGSSFWRRTALWAAGLCLLAGCGGGEVPAQPAASTPEKAPAPLAVVELREAADPPIVEAEPGAAVAEASLGDLLCEATLSDGREIVCRWNAEGNGKCWAVRLGDGTLLPFCWDENYYTEQYAVTEYENVLGCDGFRIEAPRGAAYYAYDYYIWDEDGVPRLLAGTSSGPVEVDLNGDGVQEILWYYHGGREAYYAFLLDGQVREVWLNSLIEEALPKWQVLSADPESLTEEGLTMTAVPWPWDGFDLDQEKKVRLRLTFAEETVEIRRET